MVKCKDCGYLAIRNTYTWLLDEAGGEYRDSGDTPVVLDDKGYNPHRTHELRPLCFAKCFDLRSETKSTFVSGKDEKGCVVEVISKERECVPFTKWQLGFTPKEHREMLDREKLLEWQASREDADRQFRVQMMNDDRKWQAKQQVSLILIAGIFTMIGAVIGALIGRFH